MEGWTVTIDVACQPGDIPPDALGDLLDSMADYGAAASTSRDASRYSITFSFAAVDQSSAFHTGLELVHRYAEKVGLPDEPVVRIELATLAEHDAELAAPAFPALVGVSEIAKILGVSRQRAGAIARGSGFPRPVEELAAGPVWRRSDLGHFLRDWARRPGRPRKYCPDCGGDLEPQTARGIGSRQAGQPLPRFHAGTQHCTSCGKVLHVNGDPFVPIEDGA